MKYRFILSGLYALWVIAQSYEYLEIVRYNDGYRFYELLPFVLYSILAYYSWKFVVSHIFMIRSGVFTKKIQVNFVNLAIIVLLSVIIGGETFLRSTHFENSASEDLFFLKFRIALAVFVFIIHTSVMIIVYEKLKKQVADSYSVKNTDCNKRIVKLKYSFEIVGYIAYFSVVLLFVIHFLFTNSLRVGYMLQNVDSSPTGRLISNTGKTDRRIWWYSLEKQWRDVFRTAVLESDYNYGWGFTKNLFEYIKYSFKIPIYPNDDFLLRILLLEKISVERQAIYANPFFIGPMPDESRVKVSNLSGLSQVKSLSYLDCSNNLIRDLSPLFNLPNLDTLIVYNNPIQDWSQLDSLRASVIIRTEGEYYDFIR